MSCIEVIGWMRYICDINVKIIPHFLTSAQLQQRYECIPSSERRKKIPTFSFHVRSVLHESAWKDTIVRIYLKGGKWEIL